MKHMWSALMLPRSRHSRTALVMRFRVLTSYERECSCPDSGKTRTLKNSVMYNRIRIQEEGL